MSLLDWPDEATALENATHSNTVYLSVLFPSEHRYYFEFIQDTQNTILLDHPFRLYFPQTITVEWAPPDGTNGIYLTLVCYPAFMSFGLLTVRIYIPQVIYHAIITAMQSPINSPADLVPPPDSNTSGVVEFVVLSTDAGEQIKIDLVNISYVPEIPVTVKTLQWNEVLYDIMSLPLISLPPTFSYPNTFFWASIAFGNVPWGGYSYNPSSLLHLPPASHQLGIDSHGFEFAYTTGGDLGITFIDPRYCFLREWITFPQDWTNAIKEFSGV